MKTRSQVNEDLDHILSHTQCTGTVLDELALLRIALRRYQETGNAADAVAWAAAELSNNITR